MQSCLCHPTPTPGGSPAHPHRSTDIVQLPSSGASFPSATSPSLPSRSFPRPPLPGSLVPSRISSRDWSPCELSYLLSWPWVSVCWSPLWEGSFLRAGSVCVVIAVSSGPGTERHRKQFSSDQQPGSHTDPPVKTRRGRITGEARRKTETQGSLFKKDSDLQSIKRMAPMTA